MQNVVSRYNVYTVRLTVSYFVFYTISYCTLNYSAYILFAGCYRHNRKRNNKSSDDTDKRRLCKIICYIVGLEYN